MMRASNTVVAVFNMVTLVLGLAAAGAGLFFMFGPSSSASACEKSLDKPLAYVGAALFVISFMGLVGSCCRVNFILYLYLTFMFVFIVAAFGFAIFAFLMTNKSVGHAFSASKVTDFQGRFWNNVVGGKNWNGISKCLADSDICGRASSPLKMACCQPPATCGFEAKNTTYWVATKAGALDGDCAAWSNERTTMCFDCVTCKVGFANEMKRNWKMISVVNLIVIVVCIFVYSVGCCAKTNNKKDSRYDIFSGYGGYQYRP